MFFVHLDTLEKLGLILSPPGVTDGVIKPLKHY